MPCSMFEVSVSEEPALTVMSEVANSSNTRVFRRFGISSFPPTQGYGFVEMRFASHLKSQTLM